MALRPCSRKGAEVTVCSGCTANNNPVRKPTDWRVAAGTARSNRDGTTVLAEAAQGSKVRLDAVKPCSNTFVKWYLCVGNECMCEAFDSLAVGADR